LETGIDGCETTFYLTAESPNIGALAKNPENFCLLFCNSRSDSFMPDNSNIFKTKGIENLTEIDISVTRAFRAVNTSTALSRRFCVDIISDVLLQHHAVTTRKWLGSFLQTAKAKGFTILATIDPRMHPPEETQAVLSLFDGEIRVTERDTPPGVRQVLQIRRLHNQKYSEQELILTKEELEPQ
jgi:hypothetical protein